jgi:hypothetical protein
MSPVVPKCLALILCESVTYSASTGEPSVVRAFETFPVARFPARTQRFSVWMQLTDGNGSVTLSLIIEHIPPDRVEPDVLALVKFTRTFHNPNAVLEHEAVLQDGIELEEVGRYRLRLEADGVTIMQRYFVAQLAP